MFSDAFPTEEDYNGFVMKVKSSIVEKAALKMDVGDCEDLEDKDERVNDIVDGFNYNQSTFTKAQFVSWAKEYLKAIVARLKENEKDDEYVKNFQTNSGNFIKAVVGKFEDYTFFLNEENDMAGALAISCWVDSENDKGPTFYYLKDGLTREKI